MAADSRRKTLRSRELTEPAPKYYTASLLAERRRRASARGENGSGAHGVRDRVFSQRTADRTPDNFHLCSRE